MHTTIHTKMWSYHHRDNSFANEAHLGNQIRCWETINIHLGPGLLAYFCVCYAMRTNSWNSLDPFPKVSDWSGKVTGREMFSKIP